MTPRELRALAEAVTTAPVLSTARALADADLRAALSLEVVLALLDVVEAASQMMGYASQVNLDLLPGYLELRDALRRLDAAGGEGGAVRA